MFYVFGVVECCVGVVEKCFGGFLWFMSLCYIDVDCDC